MGNTKKRYYLNLFPCHISTIPSSANHSTDPFKNTGFEEHIHFAFDHEISEDPKTAAVERMIFTEKLRAKEVEIPDGLKSILELEEDLSFTLAEMEATGVYVDSFADISERIQVETHALEVEMRELVGEVFNPLSAKQVQYILFERLGIKTAKKNKTGFSVDSDTLEEIGKEYEIANLSFSNIVDLRKLRGTITRGLAKEIDPFDHRIRATYNQTATSTGRLSSETPNLQNIPSGSEGYPREIKATFRPEKEGYSFLVADYSQVELRILAILSQDEHLINAFENHEDIHERTARFLFLLLQES